MDNGKTTRASRGIALALAAVLAAASSGCGTLLYPERKGQKGGRLDTGVVILDALGLLFFLVPGVVAFAVDFSNGTIYLPPDEEDPILERLEDIGGDESFLPAGPEGARLVAIRVGPDRDAIAAAVLRRTGVRLDRDDPRLEVVEAGIVEDLPALFAAAR